MAWNFTALACIAGAIMLGLWLMRRYLPRGAAGAAANACLHCGAPAAWLTSFTCPACGRDVREKGIGPPRGRSPLTGFWTLVVFTCLFLVIGTIASALLQNLLPRVHKVSRTVSMRLSSPQVQGVELYLDARGEDGGEMQGAVHGSLYATGGVVDLVVEIPGTSWRLLDADGNRLDSGEHLDGRVVYRWMELAGVPTDSAVAHSDATHIALELGGRVGTPLKMPEVAETGRALSLSYSSASSGTESNVNDERGYPVIIMAGSALWVGGVWLELAALAKLRRRSSRAAAGGPTP